MKKLMVAFAALAAGASAFATDYTWTGGAAGRWDDTSNWQVGGAAAADCPKAGDKAFFLSGDVTITSDIEIGEGTLTVTNPVAKVTFDCVISGAGMLKKIGDGPLYLKKANTFSGGFEADGCHEHGSNDSTGANKGQVHIYDGASLGSGLAHFSTLNGTKGTGSGLVIEVAPMTVTTQLSLGWSSGGNSIVMNAAGDVTFAEEVKFKSKGQVTGQAASNTYTFKKKVTGGTNWLTMSKGKFVFEDVFEGKSFTMNLPNTAEMHFKASGNTWFRLYNFQNPVYCYGPDTLPLLTCASSTYGWEWLDGSNNKAVIHLGGYDQTIDAISKMTVPTSIKSYGFESPTPAQVKFTGTKSKYPASITFGGTLYTAAGLKWDVAERELCLTNVLQTTTGDVSVARGTVRLTSGAGFKKLGHLSVDSAGCLALDDSADICNAEEVALENGASLSIPAGRTVTCRKLVVDNVEYGKKKGGYSAADFEGILSFEGEGRIIVGDFCQWTGAAGTGDWFDAGNWDHGVPRAGGEIILGDAGTVTLSNATPRLDSLALSGSTKLVSTGWDTAIAADAIELGAGAVVTCAGGWTNEADRARVLIECVDLTVREGATIDVKDQGWHGGFHDLWDGTGWWGSHGYGPGYGRRAMGASYGGKGGCNPVDSTTAVDTYGSAEHPEDAGSGGYYYKMSPHIEFNGGGAVRIIATGSVVLDGAINADARGVVARSGTGNSFETCGSGGGVWIDCRDISGSGSISAAGGNGGNPFDTPWLYDTVLKLVGTYTWGGRPGGGGRIAIHYDPAAQTAEAAKDLTISAAPGIHKGHLVALTAASADDYRNGAGLGTVWFTDDKLFRATFGRGLTGSAVTAPDKIVIDGDFAFTGGWVRLPAEGTELEVKGDFSISGANTRLELGGVETNRHARSLVYGGRTPRKLSVAGSFSVTGGAGFDIRSAETNGTGNAWGGEVLVGGDFTIGAGSRVQAWSDPYDCGSSRFAVGGGFTLEEGALLNADWKGGAGGNMYDTVSDWKIRGFGEGFGKNAAGGSHGGVGGTNTLYNTPYPGRVYDDPFRPSKAGSGGGCAYASIAGAGGGLIHLIAGGALLIDGTVSANGEYTASSDYRLGAGSGGTIFLAGRTFGGSGLLTAAGGNVNQRAAPAEGKTPDTTSSVAGGGGRIAVWTGRPYEEGLTVNAAKSGRVIRSATPIANVDGSPAFTGGYYVQGGTNYVTTLEMPENAKGTPGTVWFCELKEKPGALLIVR